MRGGGLRARLAEGVVTRTDRAGDARTRKPCPRGWGHRRQARHLWGFIAGDRQGPGHPPRVWSADAIAALWSGRSQTWGNNTSLCLRAVSASNRR